MMKLVHRVIASYLSFWARLVLRARRPLIVGVTGSVGKTTTKEVIATALMHPEVTARIGSVWKTPGNMNNTKGVPLVVLGYRDWAASRLQMAWWLCTMPLRALQLAVFGEYPRTLVLEFAAGPHGDIRRTASLARPTVAVVTAIGPAHLEQFGTVERIADEKAALVREVAETGLVILGKDNAIAASLDAQARSPVIKLPGRGRALSESIARVVCRYLRVPDSVIERAVSQRPTVPGRLHLQDLDTFVLIDDSYNANPLSMQLGLDTLAERGAMAARRVAVLGDMKELGAESERYHTEIATYARRCSDLVIGVGALASHYAPDHWFATSDECADALPRLLQPGDCVLVKGSHSVGLERVAGRLRTIARSDVAAV
jgi:UDP-N-acetylmuramoyl-tripeptide--D-alanyl-D-alanine ligase